MEDLPPTLTLFSPFITASPVDSRSSPCSHIPKRISLSSFPDVTAPTEHFHGYSLL